MCHLTPSAISPVSPSTVITLHPAHYNQTTSSPNGLLLHRTAKSVAGIATFHSNSHRRQSKAQTSSQPYRANRKRPWTPLTGDSGYHQAGDESQLDNVTDIIKSILDGYDIRLRPNFGGEHGRY